MKSKKENPIISDLVWYDKQKDEIFMNWFFDAQFSWIQEINWDRFELLGEL